MDRNGSVNVSRFGTRVIGIGGFQNIAQNAKVVIFSGTFTAGGLEVSWEGGQIHIQQEGRYPKFVEKLDQLSYNGKLTWQNQQSALFVTERAVFELGVGGLSLIEITPGIDLERDILAHMPERRGNLLAHLPRNKAAVLNNLLDHPVNTVGAKVDNQVLTQPGAASIEEALTYVKAQSTKTYHTVYVLGTNRQLVGEVPLGILLSVAKDTLLSTIANPCARVVSAHSSLSSVADLAEWETYDVLPVVDREKRFVGILHHTALAPRSLGKPARQASAGLGWLLANVADVYWKGATTVVGTLIPSRTDDSKHSAQGELP